ncbi:MAG: hypothetical protein EB150_08795 [Nitrososphaeria archaeon]|nr:hypothetical protein [Nitrososphaeria archaeon]NDB51672.1 hypothetical protein [Nitrosopumilaceae archaeon]NDB88198.1 hypothetical protein [Nitrososphaerota archaeon]NDB47381.1 hypothetical protein [Nitrososphaeria archaeon]NDB90123.1 hypothetical protein [Nitrososphaerota archaeon]
MIPQELTDDMADLKESYTFEIVEQDNKAYIVFRNFPLPAGVYNKDCTDLLIFTTKQYPNSNFDMFWVDQDLVLQNGQVPKSAEVIESHLGKNWRRFSYHPYNVKPWNPAQDNAASYLEYVKQRLRKGD